MKKIGELFLKLKQWLLAADTYHVWIACLLGIFCAGVINCFEGAVDPMLLIIGGPAAGFIIAIFGEVLDNWYEGGMTSMKDVARDAIGTVLAMILVAMLVFGDKL